MKKVAFTGKPPGDVRTSNPDAWVTNRDVAPREATKRLTIDVPASLHKRVKSQCALENLVMADVMRELLDRRFPAPTGAGRVVSS